MVGMRQGFMRGFGRFDASRRAVRDVILAALAGTAAAALVFHSAPQPIGAVPPAGSKLVDRLAFEQEVVPVRDTRIFDTVAMFSKLPAEPAAWAEEPVPTLRALPVQAPLRTAAAIIPRLVVASAEVTPRAVQARPPARPTDLGRKAATPTLVQDEEESREVIRLVGWSVPGSQYLPTGRDAVVTVSAVGRGAAALGHGASNAVRSGASAVGDVLSSAGRSVTSVLSFD